MMYPSPEEPSQPQDPSSTRDRPLPWLLERMKGALPEYRDDKQARPAEEPLDNASFPSQARSIAQLSPSRTVAPPPKPPLQPGELAELVHGSYRPLLDITADISKFQTTLSAELTETVIDRKSQALAQIPDLFKAVDKSESLLGSATLFRSLMQPPTSEALIHAKQTGLRELESEPKLAEALTACLQAYKSKETSLYNLMAGQFQVGMPYGTFKEAMACLRRLCDDAAKLPAPESAYLKVLVDDLKALTASPAAAFAKGPVYRTFGGVKSTEEVSWHTPRWKLTATRFSPAVLAPWAGFALSWGAKALGLLDAATGTMVSEMCKLGGYMTGFYAVYAKPIIDCRSAIWPLAQRLRKEPALVSALDALGKLDELLSFRKLGVEMQGRVCLPEIRDYERHLFRASGMLNPFLATKMPEFVPNEVVLDGQRLSIITGPNSGGKTTYCKSIIQNQLLGQIGCYIAAKECSLSIADSIAYQAPSYDALQDEEGRFGTELRRTRDIFLRLTPKSLAVLDELAEGTTSEESMEISRAVLHGFRSLGNNTLLVTHNHKLATELNDAGKGLALQVEFAGDAPTHRIVPGISFNSHALRVARKLGFAPEDIERHLREKSYAD